MNCFLVISGDIDEEHAPWDSDGPFEGAYRIRDGVWAVAGPFETCTDVCLALGMDPDLDGNEGVVVKIGEYFGLFNRTLWDKLATWRSK